jgi:hypothetical protein
MFGVLVFFGNHCIVRLLYVFLTPFFPFTFCGGEPPFFSLTPPLWRDHPPPLRFFGEGEPPSLYSPHRPLLSWRGQPLFNLTPIPLYFYVEGAPPLNFYLLFHWFIFPLISLIEIGRGVNFKKRIITDTVVI